MANLPLLVFPRAVAVEPPKTPGFPRSQAPLPDVTGQARRIEDQFAKMRAEILSVPAGADKVLVLETTGKIADFQKAAASIEGMQWLAEIDDELDFDDVAELYPDADAKTQAQLEKGGKRLYLAVSNQQAGDRLIGLWKKFRDEKPLPRGYGKWKDFFRYLTMVRHWNEDDMLRDSGLLEEWTSAVGDNEADEAGVKEMQFEVELHFRRNQGNRARAETELRESVTAAGGKFLNDPVVIAGIGFHAVKVSLPVSAIERCLPGRKQPAEKRAALSPDSIKYCRPMSAMGSVSSDDSEDLGVDVEVNAPLCADENELPPAIALLDGAPFVRHVLLDDRIVFDDPDGYAQKYQPGEHRHGTAMASLICHADINAQSGARSLTRKIYARPLMFPSAAVNQDGKREEEFEATAFPEDLTERAVRRMFAGDDAPAKSVRVINLSLGNLKKIFPREMSPWARLLDWLSWEYRVLFVVSAGNYTKKMDMQNAANFPADAIDHQNRKRALWKIISPAESVNAVTIGALNADACPPAHYNPNIDLMKTASPTLYLPALYSRLGSGYRNQIKPDILVPGGKMHYFSDGQQNQFTAREKYPHQGLRHASPLRPHTLSAQQNTPGTSNAAAVTSHAAGRIFEVLESLRSTNSRLDAGYDALLIKALLVHGASRESLDVTQYGNLKSPTNQRTWRRYLSQFTGYGVADFPRVEECTANRVTALGVGELTERMRNVFALPFPAVLAGVASVRLTVTLAWFSPVNPFHYAFRRAKLAFKVSGVSVSRCNGDHHQVKNGTVQHEIFELRNVTADSSIEIAIDCRADSGQILDDEIPYALAVTLETAESIDIYTEIAQSIEVQPVAP